MLFVGGPGGFFSAGALLLAGAVAFFYERLKSVGNGLRNAANLGVRYASFWPGPSALCVALLASATFVIVVIDSFRRSAVEGERGYRYYAESALPLFYDPNLRKAKRV